jgi:diguanylate cyclase (GGDEF)-like protein
VRLGGEEFAVLVPRAYFAECNAENLLAAVRDLEMPIGFKVTVSIGFADGSVADEERWKRLYRLADSALYRAKSDGKDRTCRATDFRAAA